MLFEVSLLVPEEIAENLSDELMTLGALSVCVEDADAQSEAEKPLYGEPGLEPTVQAWKNSRLKVLVDETFDIKATLKEACKTLAITPVEPENVLPVQDQDWVRVTQAQFSPTKISERLWIVPSWHEPPDKTAINIRLDPGVAFGTGSHPTTQLCLKWLDAHCKENTSVLDYGCGTGILAIAAGKIGATAVAGCDIDPQAIEAAQKNANENNVKATFVLPEALGTETFDVVIANILANPLKILAPALLSHVKKGGYIVLSGVLDKQAQEVISAYKALDPSLTMAVIETCEEWVCIEGKKTI